MRVCASLGGIDPRHATVIGLGVASAQGTTGTDSRWHTETHAEVSSSFKFISFSTKNIVSC